MKDNNTTHRCIGLLGWLNGHNFVHVFDTNKKPVDPDKLRDVITALKNYNFWNYANSIDPNSITTETVIKTYKFSMCKRCGFKTTDEKIKIENENIV